jgi:hypothetical protein
MGRSNGRTVEDDDDAIVVDPKGRRERERERG